MKVLLTGASGFLGRYVLNVLQQQGIETIAIGRVRPQPSVQFIEADLLQTADFGTLMQQAQATHLLHLAWYAEHGKYWTSPLNFRWLEASVRLVEAFCTNGGRHAVIAGTCAEYDWHQGYCQEESALLNPATIYGTAKDATRRMVMAACALHKVSCSWGRIFLPYGKGESNGRLIPSLIDTFQGHREPFGVYLNAYRDFLHVSDVAEGFVRLITNGSGGVYNVCSGRPVQLSEVVKTLASLMRLDPAPILALNAERPGDPPFLIGENLKLRALGWHPKFNLEEGLELTLYGESQ